MIFPSHLYRIPDTSNQLTTPAYCFHIHLDSQWQFQISFYHVVQQCQSAKPCWAQELLIGLVQGWHQDCLEKEVAIGYHQTDLDSKVKIWYSKSFRQLLLVGIKILLWRGQETYCQSGHISFFLLVCLCGKQECWILLFLTMGEVFKIQGIKGSI